MPMHRTQVYFPEEMYEFLKEEAEKKDTTLAKIVRTKIKAQMPAMKKIKKKKKVKRNAGSVLLEMAEEARKMGFKGPKDLASNVDKYLYGNI